MNPVVKQFVFPSGHVVQIAQGDITAETVDAIVNAANSHLLHGAGVAGAIARRGGSQVRAESDHWVRQHGPVSHAQPAYTHAGNLPCRFVIHAVGPVWGDGGEEEKLSAAIQGSLQLADHLGLGSIAFPAISTGIFGFPRQLAARVMLRAIQGYITSLPGSNIQLIRLVLYDQESLAAFMEEWDHDDHFSA